MTKATLLGLIFLLVETCSLAQVNSIEKDDASLSQVIQTIPSEQLLKDFELLKTAILKVHPGTYRYASEATIASELATLKRTFEQPQTLQAAYLALSKLTASVKCDHTLVGFNNQEGLINSIIHEQTDKLPFTFRWIDREMVVLQNASAQSELKRGTCISAINGVPVSEIYENLLPYVAADGVKDHGRSAKLEVNGYDFRYNAFDVFYPLRYPTSDSNILLEVRSVPHMKTKKVKVALQTREQRSKVLAERYPDFPKTRDEMWKFEVLEDSLALLTLNSFGLSGWKRMTIDYKAFLADAFNTIDSLRIQHLIIDIRENDGGEDEMANELFLYLTAYTHNFEREGRTRYLVFPEALKPHIQTWGGNPWYYQLHPKEGELQDGYYIFSNSYTQEITRSDKPLYLGKTYLLTGPTNSSLAYYTANRFRQQKLGTIIGRETGGNLRGINGGQILFLRLPHTKIEVDFPVMGDFTIQELPDAGVEPDIEVSQTIEAIAKGRDVALEGVMKLIAKNSKR